MREREAGEGRKCTAVGVVQCPCCADRAVFVLRRVGFFSDPSLSGFRVCSRSFLKRARLGFLGNVKLFAETMMLRDDRFSFRRWALSVEHLETFAW